MVDCVRIGACATLILSVFATGTSAQTPIPDTPFWQDYHESYALQTPQENDVRAISVDKTGRVWIATGAGVRFLNHGKWDAAPGDTELGPTNSVCADGRGGAWIATWNALYHSTASYLKSVAVAGTPLASVKTLKGANGDVILATGGPEGIWRR